MNKYFYLDLHREFIFFRNNIRRSDQNEAIKALLRSLREPLVGCERDMASADRLNHVLRYTLNCLRGLLDDKAYEEAYDLVDAIHVLPELMAYQKLDNLNEFWGTYIVPLKRKWRADYFQEFEEVFLK